MWLLNKVREDHRRLLAPRTPGRDRALHTGVWVTTGDPFTQGADPNFWTKNKTIDGAGTVRLYPNEVAGGGTTSIAYLDALVQSPIYALSTDRTWRLEVAYGRSALAAGSVIKIGMGSAVALQLYPDRAQMSVYGKTLVVPGTPSVATARETLTIECRDRWIFFYRDGQLLGVLPNALSTARLAPTISLLGRQEFMDVDSVLLRVRRPFLMRGTDKGDLRLPGAPAPPAAWPVSTSTTPTSKATSTRCSHRSGSPTPRRLDSVLDFLSATVPPAWQPIGPAGGSNFSARWTGSIFLDLAQHDHRVRAAACDDRARIWVAGNLVVDDWTAAGHGPLDTTSTSLRDVLGAIDGWYPIVIEYGAGGAPNTFSLRQDIDGGGVFSVVPTDRLSPPRRLQRPRPSRLPPGRDREGHRQLRAPVPARTQAARIRALPRPARPPGPRRPGTQITSWARPPPANPR